MGKERIHDDHARQPLTGRVAVVVITRDRAGELLHTLGRLAALPERPQVVVVDQGSRDLTVELVRERFPGVALIALGSETANRLVN